MESRNQKAKHKMTNFERIKEMSIDELTLFLHSIDHEEYGFVRIDNKTMCNEDLKEWLESEAEE